MHRRKENIYIVCSWINLVIIPLLIAGVVYYLFFPDVIFVRYIDRFAGFDLHIHLPYNHLLEIVRNYSFDVVWAVSLISASYLIYKDDISVQKITIVGVSFETVMECLQLIPWIPGTFDIVDIVVEIMASIIVLVCLIKGGKI